jgi:hypothetical protein
LKIVRGELHRYDMAATHLAGDGFDSEVSMDEFWKAFFTALPPTLMGLAAVIMAFRNQSQIADVGVKTEETHKLFNSRMTELMEVAKQASRAEGKAEGKAEGPGSPSLPMH